MTVQTTTFTQIDVLPSTVTSTAGAATISTQTSVVTTETLTTAAGATYTFTLTNTLINANTVINAIVGKGTATTGGLVPIFCTPTAGSAVIIFQNVTLAAVNGTVKLYFSLLNIN
jgi:hypothetical protein